MAGHKRGTIGMREYLAILILAIASEDVGDAALAGTAADASLAGRAVSESFALFAFNVSGAGSGECDGPCKGPAASMSIGKKTQPTQENNAK